MKVFRRGTASSESTLTDTLGNYELPSFPSVAISALDMLAAQADLEDIIEVLSVDPGLSVRLLHIVNSPAFAPRIPISSVHRAAVMVGRNRLESVLITTAVAQSLPRTGLSADMSAAFWHNAAIRASAAALVAARFDMAHRSEHFTAALLQDMAQPILAQANAAYGDIWTQWHRCDNELLTAEVDQLGWSHVDVGVEMSRRWEFPEKLTSLISVHHEEATREDDIGHRIARWTSLIEAGEPEELTGIACDWFDLGADEVVDLLDAAEEHASSLAVMFR